MGFGGVIASLSCRWLNHPHRIAVAEYKPFQLAAAAAVGLRVPATLITNDPETVREFVERFQAGVVYKSLSGSPPPVDGRSLALYTTVLEPTDHSHPGLARTANFFQERVPKAYEVRMTVVGDHLFAVRIDTDSPSARIDWRSDYSSLRYAVEVVPNHVRGCVLKLLHGLGLDFGALDFIVTPKREWVFLEINPNGQWGWLEHATGLPITAGIADFLQEDVH
jgi:glutathione synthase/RimK-type ligase-like ATP-grasp enzyme